MLKQVNFDNINPWFGGKKWAENLLVIIYPYYSYHHSKVTVSTNINMSFCCIGEEVLQALFSTRDQSLLL